MNKNGHTIRPASTYYEYETFHYGNGNGLLNTSNFSQHSSRNNSQRKIGERGSPMKWNSPGNNSFNGSGRSRGPFVTQVTIREQQQQQPSQGHHIPSNHIPSPTSKV